MAKEGGDAPNLGEPFKKGQIEGGPAKNRGCTDIICLLLFIGGQAAFVFVTMMGMGDGNPSKLYRQRDFRGEYCGVDKNWNNGLNLENQQKLTQMMNVSSTTHFVMKQFICSSVVEKQITALWASGNPQAYSDYMCACCKNPCSSCTGSFEATDITSLSGLSSIGSKMTELTSPSSGNIFSPSGANGDFGSTIMTEATKYFVGICTTSCGATTVEPNRTYTYMPDTNDPLYPAFWAMKNANGVAPEIKNTINNQFVYSVLPKSVCPYEAKYCVPFPGMDFDEIPGNICMFKLAASAVNAVGNVAAQTFAGLGADRIKDAAVETVGSWWGDFVDTIDAFILTALASFVIGLLFLVLLRFFVGVIVWLAILVVFLMLLAGGALCYVRSYQCAGAGLLESGKAQAFGVAVAAQNAASGGDTDGEALTGKGEDYRGSQRKTRTGRLCQSWGSQTPHFHTYNSTTYPLAGLNGSYCRNPNGAAPSIWCYTTDADKRWELCSPIGVINAECTRGFAVESETMRKVLEIFSYVIWGIAALWFLLVLCMCRQIMLAIAVNKVAAKFTAENPQVLLVLPLTQILIGVLWCLAWAVSAAFLLSQVPKDQVPITKYTTYLEAYGSDDTPGKCTDAFVNGEVYKYGGDLSSTSDPCTGNMGDITGITPACWACFPPRYVIGWQFAVSFFVYLWNCAFLIAIGQFLVASACCTWFFAPRGQKGASRPVSVALKHCFRYHLGSLAFGAFLIALVQFIRYAMMYFEKQAMASKNKLAACVLRIVQCCLWCLEKCIKFLNKNAYIQIALMGTSFCTSAKNAVMLILRNMARFGWVTLLGGVVNVIGVAFILIATAVAGFFILKNMHEDVTPVLPMVVYVFMGYMVAKLFMNVFHLACGTVLQCFLATEEMGGDTGFVPEPMMSFVKDMKSDEKEDTKATS